MMLSSACLLTAPQVSVKYEGCDIVIGGGVREPTFTCAWVRLIVVKPLGPEIVQEGFEAGGLLTAQEKVTLVGVFLRTRVGLVEKVMMVGEVSVQVLGPELYEYPLFATQLGYVPGQLAGQTGFSVQVLLNEL